MGVNTFTPPASAYYRPAYVDIGDTTVTFRPGGIPNGVWISWHMVKDMCPGNMGGLLNARRKFMWSKAMFKDDGAAFYYQASHGNGYMKICMLELYDE